MDLSIRSIIVEETASKTNNHFVFKPTEDECKNGLMHICFGCSRDCYLRKPSNDESYEWKDSTYSCTNLFCKYECDWNMTYLARNEDRVDPPAAEVSWKFDVNETDVKMSKLELKAPCKLYEDGCVIWTICSDQRKFVQTGTSLQDFVTFELDGATTLTITAFLAGGRGSCQYQHAQLFRQNYSDQSMPFEIKLFLEPSLTKTVPSAIETVKEADTATTNSDEIKKCYIFTPNEKECDDKAMHIVYNAQTDRYSRSSPDTESLVSWMDYTYCSTNILRKEDGTEENAYLTRGESNDFGKISWKFDLKDSGLRPTSLSLLAPSTASSAGSVVWIVSSGKQCFMEEGNAMQERTTFDLKGSTELSITAFVKGGEGEDSGPQVELFVKPFEIHLSLEEVPPVATGALEPKGEEGEDIGYTFKPTEEEIKNKFMHICYSCNQDAYMRKSSNDELLHSWEKYTFSKMNLFHCNETSLDVWFLARKDANQNGEVSWKFDMDDSGLQMNNIEIRANTQAFADSSVIWTIWDGEHVQRYESLQDFKSIELRGSSTLTITARTEKALGQNSLEDTQRIFPQHYDDKDGFPFEIKIFLANPRHLDGNIDASEWSAPSGSFGIPAEICRKEDTFFVFKPTEEEIESKMMHISYNCSSDSYSRGFSDENQPSSWSEGTYSCMNVLRKDNDDGMAYLARIGGTQYAEVTWKFDVSETDLEINDLELRASNALYEGANILWTIRAGEEVFIRTGQCFPTSCVSETITVYGTPTLSITAFLAGGKGLAAWKHAQLFRQKLDDQGDCPFQVKLFLRQKYQHALTESCSWINGELGLPARCSKESLEKFVFKPTRHEIKNGLLHICYDPCEDVYIRKSSSDEILKSWDDYIYSFTNLHLKIGGSQCLRRRFGSQTGEVTWKFDVGGTGSCMTKLELKALVDIFSASNGCVVFTIESDDRKYVQTGPSLDEVNTFDLNGSMTLSITALLAGGSGPKASEHAELFPYSSMFSSDLPFDIKLFMKPKSDWVPWFSARNVLDKKEEGLDRHCVDKNKYFSFKPTEQECKDGKIHLTFDTKQDKYSRLTSEGCEETQGWNELVYTSSNLMRVERREEKLCFLSRKRGAEFADVSWKFDLTGTNLTVVLLELKAKGIVYSNGYINWRISTDNDKQCLILSGNELLEMKTFELGDSKTLTITAFLRGDTGPKLWNDIRLFEEMFECAPFDVTVHFDKILPQSHHDNRHHKCVVA